MNAQNYVAIEKESKGMRNKGTQGVRGINQHVLDMQLAFNKKYSWFAP